MNDANNVSLSDTLKEILEEENSKASSDVTEPKKSRRGRKPKSESKETTKEVNSSALPEKSDTIINEKTVKSEIAPEIEKDNPSDISTSENTLEASEGDSLIKPEIIPETEKDTQADISDLVSKPEESSDMNLSAPEIVPETEKDTLPDIEIASKPAKNNHDISGNAVSAFTAESISKTKFSWVGQSVILKDMTAMYRSPHRSMKCRSYKGLVTAVEEPRYGFVKVQYVRPAFGLCENYISVDNFMMYKQGDADEKI